MICCLACGTAPGYVSMKIDEPAGPGFLPHEWQCRYERLTARTDGKEEFRWIFQIPEGMTQWSLWLEREGESKDLVLKYHVSGDSWFRTIADPGEREEIGQEAVHRAVAEGVLQS